MLALQLQAKKLKKEFKVDVFQADGKTFRDLPDIIDDLSRAGVTVAKLKKEGLDVRAARGLSALADGAKMFRDLSEQSVNVNTIQNDKLRRQESIAFKMQKRFNKLRETFIKLFTPERIEAFVEGMSKIGELAGFLVENIKAVAALFAGIKISGFAIEMASIARSAGAASQASMGMAGALGKAHLAMGALSALAAGFTLGTALDQALGISDAISDALVATKKFEESGFLRDRAQGFAAATGLTGAFRQRAGLQQPNEALTQAQQLVRQSRDQGILGADGQVNVGAAAQAATERLSTAERVILEKTGRAPNQQTQDLIRQIESAQALVKEAQEQRAKGIEVRVIIDQEGRASAVGNERTGGVD